MIKWKKNSKYNILHLKSRKEVIMQLKWEIGLKTMSEALKGDKDMITVFTQVGDAL